MSKTIMVVDDSKSWRMLTKTALVRAGYEVLEAFDGQDAVNKLENTKVHLIICDVNMPNMDGIAFVKELKRLPTHKFTPVIMLTTVGQEDVKQQGQEAGAKAWITKPFRVERMLVAVSKFILP